VNKAALNIKPFTRKVWKSNKIKREWEEKINRISRLYHEAEWNMVARGNRDVCTVHMSKNDYDYLNKKLTEDEMFWYPLHKTANYDGFSHTHIEPQGDEYNHYGVAGKTKESVMKFKEADEKGNHYKIGELLGFPECCQKFFQEYFVEKQDIDPIFPSAKNTDNSEYIQKQNKEIVVLKHTDFEALQVLRYFGFRITSHLPCSMDCERTKEKAELWKETMKDMDLGAYNILKEILNMSFKWDANNGILEVTTPIFKGITTTGIYDKRRIIKKGKLDW